VAAAAQAMANDGCIVVTDVYNIDVANILTYDDAIWMMFQTGDGRASRSGTLSSGSPLCGSKSRSVIDQQTAMATARAAIDAWMARVGPALQQLVRRRNREGVSQQQRGGTLFCFSLPLGEQTQPPAQLTRFPHVKSPAKQRAGQEEQWCLSSRLTGLGEREGSTK